ncbi:MAG TPA: cytochrome c oxidase assembly protein [Trueperaceae bacterium]
MLQAAARAHTGAPPLPDDVWWAWSWDPLVLFGLTVAAGLYGGGLRRLWRRAGVGQGIHRVQAAAFGVGLLTLFLALESPLDALSSGLFSAHMLQHLLLMVVAAPLLVVGAPGYVLLWSLNLHRRRALARWWQRAALGRRLWRVLTAPLFVWLLYTLTLWLWHLPGPYQATLRSEVLHVGEHVSFLGVATLFWWAVLQPMGKRRLGRGAAALFLFAASLQGSALGVLITFAPHPWYPAYAPWTPLWGLTPLQDQQLAGLIMWMPVGMLYVVLAAILVAQWLGEEEQAEHVRAPSPVHARLAREPWVQEGGAS